MPGRLAYDGMLAACEGRLSSPAGQGVRRHRSKASEVEFNPSQDIKKVCAAIGAEPQKPAILAATR